MELVSKAESAMQSLYKSPLKLTIRKKVNKIELHTLIFFFREWVSNLVFLTLYNLR